DRPIAHFRVSVRHLLVAVLHVPLFEALRVLLEIRQGVVSGKDHPVKIHLYAYEFGIELLEHDVEEQLTVSGVLEFEVVVVVPDLHAVLLTDFPALIDRFTDPLDAVECAVLFWQPGYTGVFLTQRFGVGNSALPIIPYEIDAEMTAHGLDR